MATDNQEMNAVKTVVKPRLTFGREPIYTSVREITEENVVTVLNESVSVHYNNSADIDYLYKYRNGRQPILSRQKTIRPEINNKIVVNTASEIVSFKSGYLTGEPIQYVSRDSDEEKNAEFIEKLNDYMYVEQKAEKDSELSEWAYICGTSYRFIKPNKKYAKDDVYGEESPFKIYTLDPRDTFVIRSKGLEGEVLAGVKYALNEQKETVFGVYTSDMYYEIINDIIVFKAPHNCGGVPIIEYPANSARLGSFELCLPLLDARNIIESNRCDGVEQFIQSLLVISGGELDEEGFATIKEEGGLCLPVGADAKYLNQELNQTQTQALIDNLYNAVLTISGMPSQGDGNTSDSSNNGAVIVRNGWQHAESRAKETVGKFIASEKEMLKIAFHLIHDVAKEDLIKLSSIEVKFTRCNFENLLVKAQVLTMMLSSGKVDPLLCFKQSGMFTDPELAWSMSKDYILKNEQKAKEISESAEPSEESESNNIPKVNNIGVEEPEADDGKKVS